MMSRHSVLPDENLGKGQPRKSLHVGFVLAKDFTLSAFSLFIDTLRLAGDEGDRSGRVHCDWEVLSSTQHHIRSSAGIEVAPTSALGDPSRFTHIAVVGGLLDTADPLDSKTREFLRSANRAQVPLVGICTGSFILADCGLMKGRKACVSWFHFHQFRERYPEVEPIADRLFFVDGNRITCAGGAGAADIAGFLIERRLGASAKEKAMQVLQIERARQPSDPQPRAPLGGYIPDDRIRRALLIMEQNMAPPLQIVDVAARCGVTARALERIFRRHLDHKPAEAYLHLRLEAAKTRVVMSRETMTEIAMSTGFVPSHFSHKFKKVYGSSPTAFRQKHTSERSAIG